MLELDGRRDCRVQVLYITHGEAKAQRGKQLSGTHESEAKPRLLTKSIDFSIQPLDG